MATAVLGLRIVLAVVFTTAGVGKLLDLAGSRRAVLDFGVPERAARVAGTLLPTVELGTAVALLLRPSARWGALAALILLAAFIAGIARALARGEQPDCHCFGQIHSAPAGPITLARNAVLAACAVVVVAYGSGPAVDAWVNARSAAELVAVGAVVCAIAAVAYALTLRGDIQRLTRDLGIARQAAAAGRSGLPVGFDAPGFTLPGLAGAPVTLTSLRERGQPVLLLFVTPWCGPCAEFLPRVQQWQQSLSTRLTIAVISSGTVEQNASFAERGLEDVLLQEGMEVAEVYGARYTPSAVFVSREGKIGSNLGETDVGIEPLVRLALRDGVGAPMEGSVA
jgi:thiol-disulfide isomerase/thioredoxin/uncharacterized membrane protein YphA (DoxX/SURF4 family)